MSAYVLAKVGAISFDRSPSLQNQKSKQTKATNYTVADLEGKGASRLAPPPQPLGDGLTPSLTVVLANAKF